MAKNTAQHGLIALPFSLNSGYTTAALGDKVMISGDMEVAAVTDDAYAVGEIIAIEAAADNKAEQVTVELRSAKVDTIIASGAVTAGQGIVSFSATQGRTFVPATDEIALIYGVALTGAADTVAFDVVVF